MHMCESDSAIGGEVNRNGTRRSLETARPPPVQTPDLRVTSRAFRFFFLARVATALTAASELGVSHLVTPMHGCSSLQPMSISNTCCKENVTKFFPEFLSRRSLARFEVHFGKLAAASCPAES